MKDSLGTLRSKGVFQNCTNVSNRFVNPFLQWNFDEILKLDLFGQTHRKRQADYSIGKWQQWRFDALLEHGIWIKQYHL